VIAALHGAKTRLYVAVMVQRDIAAAQRAPFFERLSRLHEGALITVRAGAKDEIVDQPFRGVSEEGTDVVVHTGDRPGAADESHRVPNAIAVALEETDEGADAAVAIVSRDGARTEIRFRSPMRADLLEPDVE
jgi:hypothetical protein